ncbi:MAG: holo-[acyl-carrier-protein] synthase [Candidatus Acidulodesulfobacterium acidiphilum]|uniref:Holo-[acyl-carrier-protein] synthase n=1 Tax=Candidatus Acidulodesulfobacterium acidiphilum TaxID=2597224 RepID=A0A520X751_9DELT|nr:MAG: holo-[acyl-carrier-protein] synthase [Candidatus Acidulodesulfobacterium acidiphilum]
MINGIGIDLISVDKIKKAIEMRGEKFYSRVFSDTESDIIEKIKSRNEKRAFEKAAGYFAAKEAFLKALGKGLFSIPLNKIKILNDESGRPYINLDSGLFDNISAKVSITHDKGFACAVVIL